MILITGATGKLGHQVLAQLLEKVPARDVAVAVRDPENAADLAAKGVDVRYADYSKPETLSTALTVAGDLRDDEKWYWVVFILAGTLLVEGFVANRTPS